MLFRRLTTSEARDPRKRQYAEFWNLVHSLEHTSNVRLGVWRDKQPVRTTTPVISSTPHAVFGWPGRSKPNWAPLPIDALEQNPEILGTGEPNNVVLARRNLPKTLFQALEQRYDYHPDLDGQEEGWWFTDGRSIPRSQPRSRSTIALLPEASGLRSHGLQEGVECLVLVEVDDWWAVLSERALRVYEVGAALDDHRPVQLAQWKKGRRTVWDVELAASITAGTVQRRFGRAAARRAIPDVKSIVVRCKRHA